MRNRLRVLLLCDERSNYANTVHDHIDAFRRYSRHEVRTFNPTGMHNSVALDLSAFDVVVVHYSLVLSSTRYVSPAFREKLRRYRGLKVQFIQDEYRWVDRSTAASRDVGVDVLFTCAPGPQAGRLYDEGLPGVRRVPTLTGYVPVELENRPLRPHSDRPFDVGYRGRDLPYWLGRLTQEKTWIAQGFLARAEKYGLNVDIGWREQDRVYGERWVEFISSCRATLGTESGASIADFDGTVEAGVTAHLKRHPEATYEEVYQAVLRPYEGNVVVNVISPRVFEAAALGTALVMFPGTYSAIPAPHEHYLVLEKDFSNMDVVAEQLKDRALIEGLARRAHRDLVASGRWSYASFIREFDAVLDEEAKPAGRGAAASLPLANLERALRVPPLHVRAIRGIATPVASLTHRQVNVADDFQLWPFLVKGALAASAPIADPWMRRIYRAGRGLGVPRGQLLEEMLKLSLLRRAIHGELDADVAFTVEPQLESSARLRFVSTPGAARSPASSVTPTLVVDVAGLKSIEWDHSAVGTTLRLRRPRVEVGVGVDGVKHFPALTKIARADPGIIGEMIPTVTAEPAVRVTPLN